MKFARILILLSIPSLIQAQDSLKVHFLHGSKPKKEFSQQESKWFGGFKGGHVGIAAAENKILNFGPRGSFHILNKDADRHSYFKFDSETSFYSIFGGQPEDMRSSIISIPISKAARIKFDSLSKVYKKKTPYDYAFFGMRCASASYEILSQLQIIKTLSRPNCTLKIFYPKKLRNRLLKLAQENNWPVQINEGSSKRKWEK